jgi:alpha-L-fucosidase
VQRLKQFGDAIRQRYGNNLALKHRRGSPDEELAFDGNPDTFWSAPTGSHHALLELSFEKAVAFDRALTMEWLNDGQNVQQYAIEVFQNDKWVAVSRGYAIGHKKIDRFPLITASRVRLNVLSSSGEVQIREFQLFNTGETAK